jgi:hypothetical protein
MIIPAILEFDSKIAGIISPKATDNQKSVKEGGGCARTK